jgi:hypothetical protein
LLYSIYMESGRPSTGSEGCHRGDIMEFELDFDKKKCLFRKNGEEVSIDRNILFCINFKIIM